MTLFRNNPDFKLEIEHGPYCIYTPVDIANGYSTQRYIEALNQQDYANSGGNKEVWSKLADQLIDWANSTHPVDDIRTNMGLIGQNMRYRLQYPVDQHCAVRMGAILSFIEYKDAIGMVVTEDPADYKSRFTQLKETLAHQHPDLYAFFLSWGIANLPEYRKALDGSTAQDYFNRRTEAIRTLQHTPTSQSDSVTSPSTNPA